MNKENKILAAVIAIIILALLSIGEPTPAEVKHAGGKIGRTK